MARKIKATISFNKLNKQFNLSLPKKKISKNMLEGLKKSKSVEIDLLKLYPT
ncbi:hypothetical protein LCGC14_0953660 [marine sediment metagenome]|uniref:Uncharacterized protein n=1 Tax=marine sediment metagenome TaxID=412755 RepID=A0A0F9QZV2_9ZZZZ